MKIQEVSVEDLRKIGLAEVEELNLEELQAASQAELREPGDEEFRADRPREPGETDVCELPETGLTELKVLKEQKDLKEADMDEIMAACPEADPGGGRGESTGEFRADRPREPGETDVCELPETVLTELKELKVLKEQKDLKEADMDEIMAACPEADPCGGRGESTGEFRADRPREPGETDVCELPETGLTEMKELKVLKEQKDLKEADMDEIMAACPEADPGGGRGESTGDFRADRPREP
ncbi:MAG: hypothetical protein LBT40_00225 [Deltaproteobacteria bacterium]|nr:hypothetical protein [Deltaproteobacteria bacterium]